MTIYNTKERHFLDNKITSVCPEPKSVWLQLLFTAPHPLLWNGNGLSILIDNCGLIVPWWCFGNLWPYKSIIGNQNNYNIKIIFKLAASTESIFFTFMDGWVGFCMFFVVFVNRFLTEKGRYLISNFPIIHCGIKDRLLTAHV